MYLACTRFNNSTYEENMAYRRKHNYSVIYGTSLKICDIYPLGSLIFVVEMNNETNLIEGIGLIENKLLCDRYHKIYTNTDYNTYIYRGKCWIGKENIDPDLIEIFNNILFKRKSHLKRRIGITIITDKLLTSWNYDLFTVKKQVHDNMQRTKLDNIDKIDKIDNIDKIDKDIEEEIIIIPKKRKRTITDKNIEILH